jgi:hypothetical protein
MQALYVRSVLLAAALAVVAAFVGSEYIVWGN